MHNLPVRKNIRYKGYDYSSQGSYFVTISTYHRKNLFWENNSLNVYGKIVEKHIENLPTHYYAVKIDNYAVMPNHIHLLITIGCDALPNEDSVILDDFYGKIQFPLLGNIVGSLKSGITKEIHNLKPDLIVWQQRYYDHIINNINDYNETWDYIENNPNVWIAKQKINRSNNRETQNC